jgi:hypothetical protein
MNLCAGIDAGAAVLTGNFSPHPPAASGANTTTKSSVSSNYKIQIRNLFHPPLTSQSAIIRLLFFHCF